MRSGREHRRTFDGAGRAPVELTSARIQGVQKVIAADAEEMDAVAARSQEDHAIGYHGLKELRPPTFRTVAPHDMAIARAQRIHAAPAHVDHLLGDAHVRVSVVEDRTPAVAAVTRIQGQHDARGVEVGRETDPSVGDDWVWTGAHILALPK